MMGTEEQPWWQQVKELTRFSQEQRGSPLSWAVEVNKCLQGAGIMMPCLELGQLLISLLCWSNNGPMLWKYIEQALVSRLVPPLQILALLTSRVIPHRQSQPEAYRLYMELLSRYAFSLASTNMASDSAKIVKAVDDALQLSQSFRLPVTELGQIVVLFIFTLVSSLVDAIAEDFGLQLRWSEEQYRLTGNMGQHDMTMEVEDDSNSKRHEHRENLRRTNIGVAVDMEVRVRFAGFGAEEDEWVNVRKCVRQRSLPCESSECVAVLPGDLILCFQHFESFVREHFHQWGHYILGACNAYMMGAQA